MDAFLIWSQDGDCGGGAVVVGGVVVVVVAVVEVVAGALVVDSTTGAAVVVVGDALTRSSPSPPQADRATAVKPATADMTNFFLMDGQDVSAGAGDSKVPQPWPLRFS